MRSSHDATQRYLSGAVRPREERDQGRQTPQETLMQTFLVVFLAGVCILAGLALFFCLLMFLAGVALNDVEDRD